MSNNSNWKRILQNKINEHNHIHGTKSKDVSYKTRHERACSLFRSFTLIRQFGFQTDPTHLRGKHIQTLVDYWTCNPRIAEQCRKQGVPMLERAHSAAYLELQLSYLRVYADSWIGRPGLVLPLERYVDDPSRFKRSYSASRDKSWVGNDVDFNAIAERAAQIDPHVAAQLALIRAFGLRRKEAIMFMPNISVIQQEDLPKGQALAESYAVFLRVKRGTKGGRLRFVAIRNDEQRAALEIARKVAPGRSSHMGRPGLSLIQSLKRFDNVMQGLGITLRALGVTAHGLRHEFAHELHVELTNVEAPVRGGESGPDPQALRVSLLEIARQLGHSRSQITGAYVGSHSQARRRAIDQTTVEVRT